jgi:LPXTG-motif cell wall-anchored protein
VTPDESQTPVKLTVHYVDENGNQLSADKEVTGTQGTDFTESAVAVSGYTPTQREISGTYQGNVMDLTFTYTKDGVTPDESQTPVKLTVHYVDENGNQLSADKEATGIQGDSFTEAAVAISGYTPTQREVSGTYKGNVMDLTFTYTKDGVTPDESQTPVKLTVHYVDENGNQLSADKEVTGTQGTDFTENAVAVSGYTPTQREVSGTYQGNVMNLTFVYTKDGVTPDESQTPVKLTVHYVDENGNQLSADKEATGIQGDSFTEAAVAISGYTPTQREVSGTYQGNVMNLTFTYTKDGVTPDESQTPVKLTVHYVDENGNQLSADKEVTGVQGTDFTENAVAVSGYTPTQREISGTYQGNVMNLTFTYTKDGVTPDEGQTPVKLTVHYVDENGNQLSMDKEVTGTQGTDFTESAVAVSGYTPTQREISGTYQGNVMNLTFVYTKDGVTPDESQTLVKLTIHYVDENGNQLSADKEVTGTQGNNFEEAAAIIPGYTPTEREISGTYQGNAMNLTFTYTKDGVTPDESQTPVKLTVHYVDENGNQLSADKEVNGTQGTDFTENAVAVSGYTPTQREISGTYKGNVMNLTFVYTKDGVTPDESQTPVKLTVHYVDENGNQLSADKEVTGTQGTDFTENAVAVSGYTPTQREISGTYQGNVMTLTFVYTLNDSDNNGQPTLPDDGNNKPGTDGSTPVTPETTDPTLKPSGENTVATGDHTGNVKNDHPTGTSRDTTPIELDQATGITQVSDHTQATSSKDQQESDQKLPQTDQRQETMLTVIGLALMSMLGLLGIGKKSRRN